MEINEHLNNINADVLRAAAKELGVFEKGMTRKLEYTNAVRGILKNQLQHFVACLDESQKQFLALSIQHDRIISKDMFKAIHPESSFPGSKYDSYSRYASFGFFDNRKVNLLALVIACDSHQDAQAHIPSPVNLQLRALLPGPGQRKIKTYQQPPDIKQDKTVKLFEGESLVLRELVKVLRLVQSKKISVSASSKRPSSASVKLVNQSFLVPDFDLSSDDTRDDDPPGSVRAHAWSVLIQQCGWAKVRSGKLILTKEGKSLLDSANHKDLYDGFNHFLYDDSFDEFNRINHIRGQSGKAKRYLTDPSERKQSVCEGMADLPINEWVSFDEVITILISNGQLPEVIPERYSYHLYLCEKNYGHFGGDAVATSRQYVRALLMESLATLGVVDIAYTDPFHLWHEFGGSWGRDAHYYCSRYDGLCYVRINPLGAYLLDIVDDYNAPEPAPTNKKLFTVLSNHEIVIKDRENFGVSERMLLEQMAILLGEDRWKIQASQIFKTLDEGGSLDEMQQFLEEFGNTDLPETVADFWISLREKTRVCKQHEESYLLKFDDETLALLLANSKGTTGKYCRYAGDGFLVVPRKRLQAFSSAMRKEGYYMPKLNC